MTELPELTACVFDLDGTLVDTVGTRVDAWLDVFRGLGIAAERHFVAPLMGSDGKRVARTVAERYGAPLEPGRDAEIDRLAGERFGQLNRRPRPLPGVGDVLDLLDERQVPWAIATSSRPDEVDVSVAALRRERLPMVVDGSHVEHAKPAPDLLLQAADRLRLVPASIWYVGDSEWDMLAAVAAGMVAVGVTTGAVERGPLAAAGAALVVASLVDLVEPIRRATG